MQFVALVAYPIDVERKSSMERRRRYGDDHAYTLLGFLPVGISELKGEDLYLKVDESVSLCGLTPSDAVLLKGLIPQFSWRGGQKECITVLAKQPYVI